MTISLDQAYAVLTDAAEDCTGLWGAVWRLTGFVTDMPEVQENQEPDHSPKYEVCVSHAQYVLQRLFELGWIEFCRGVAWPPSALTEKTVQPNEVAHIFAHTPYWYVPVDPVLDYICFSATESGMQVWREGKQSFLEKDIHDVV